MYIYLLHEKNFTSKNIYKFGSVKPLNITTFIKSNTPTQHSPTPKKSDIVFHMLLNNNIFDDIYDMLKNNFTLRKYLKNEYFEGNYVHMINLIYSFIIKNNKSNELIKNINCEEFEKNNYIYLLREREFIKLNQEIYKIGMTTKSNYGRFLQYPKNSELLFQMKCINCVKNERTILKKFENKYIKQTDIGSEYFEGNVLEMINIIYDVIMNEYETISKKQNNTLVKEIRNNTLEELQIIEECIIHNHKYIGKKKKHNNILKSIDINDDEYILLTNKCILTDDEKNKLKKHELKKLYGVEKLNENILKLDELQIENYYKLTNVHNCEDNEIIMITDLLKNIGFDDINDNNKYIEKTTIEKKRNEIIQKSKIFNNIQIKKQLLNENINSNKAFLGYVNTILKNVCLKINSLQIRLHKLKTHEKKNMTEEQINKYNEKQKKKFIVYKLERLFNIDEIIDYKIKKEHIIKQHINKV
jgi:hypothetical protein